MKKKDKIRIRFFSFEIYVSNLTWKGVVIVICVMWFLYHLISV